MWPWDPPVRVCFRPSMQRRIFARTLPADANASDGVLARVVLAGRGVGCLAGALVGLGLYWGKRVAVRGDAAEGRVAECLGEGG